jgi:hypothetical protein
MARALAGMFVFISLVVAVERPARAGSKEANASVRRILRNYERLGPRTPLARQFAQAFGRIGTRRGQSIDEMKRRFLALDGGIEFIQLDARDAIALYFARRDALVRINQRLGGREGATPTARAVRARIAFLERARERARTGWLKLGSDVVVGELGSSTHFFVHQKHLDARRLGATGRITERVTGLDGAWAVQHPNGEVGVYMGDELRPATAPSLPPTQGLWLPERKTAK